MRDQFRYAAHEDLVSPARLKPQIWRIIVGMILVSGVYLICNQMFFQGILTLMGSGARGFLEVLQDSSNPLALLILLMTFGFMTLGVAVAVRVAHNRGFTSVLGDLSLARRQFSAVMVLLILINVVIFILPPWNMGAPFVRNLDTSVWLMLLPFSLIAVFVQVSAEEVLFRGYLQQQLAARFSSPLIWITVPSLLFGLGHYMPEQAGDNATLIVISAIVYGLLMADLTARAGTLGPAIALHFANNIMAILVISMPGELSALALFLAPFSMENTEMLRAWLPVDFAMMLVSYLAARLAIRR